MSGHSISIPPKGDGERCILIPFDPAEGMSIHHAAKQAGVHPATMRRWCEEFGLGRHIGRRAWTVSRVALRMYLDGDMAALAAYHAGDRVSAKVAGYFRHVGLRASAA